MFTVIGFMLDLMFFFALCDLDRQKCIVFNEDKRVLSSVCRTDFYFAPSVRQTCIVIQCWSDGYGILCILQTDVVIHVKKQSGILIDVLDMSLVE